MKLLLGVWPNSWAAREAAIELGASAGMKDRAVRVDDSLQLWHSKIADGRCEHPEADDQDCVL